MHAMHWPDLGGLIHCRKGLVSQLLCLLVQVPGLLLKLGHQRLKPSCKSQHVPAYTSAAWPDVVPLCYAAPTP